MTEEVCQERLKEDFYIERHLTLMRSILQDILVHLFLQ